MESTVTKFANFIEKSADIEIPNSTLHSAKLIVADCLGAIVGVWQARNSHACRIKAKTFLRF